MDGQHTISTQIFVFSWFSSEEMTKKDHTTIFNDSPDTFSLNLITTEENDWLWHLPTLLLSPSSMLPRSISMSNWSSLYDAMLLFDSRAKEEEVLCIRTHPTNYDNRAKSSSPNQKKLVCGLKNVLFSPLSLTHSFLCAPFTSWNSLRPRLYLLSSKLYFHCAIKVMFLWHSRSIH